MMRVPDQRQILGMAAPIIVANCATPLLGLVDTAVIGHVGTTSDLGAIAFGALIFSFLFWSFGFLRMGTSGFTAQAAGADDHAEIRATLGRALLLAGGLGTTLILLQYPLALGAFSLLQGSAEVEAVAADYFSIRIWGAPAALANFALIGLFIGLGRTRQVLHLQLLLNGLNIVLDLWFAGLLQWGVAGIALGTALSEWSALAVGLWLAGRELARWHGDTEVFWPWPRITDRRPLLRMLRANG
ncbi:MAG: MATE family efflux transporter, partial [Candidatus Competibacterales bacterium]|nr:MATE family efflux transporter [Candidatus Competibacterales bacterium]